MRPVQVYCNIVRSVLEYASPVWAALPKYLDDAIPESAQKAALRFVLPNCHCDDALIHACRLHSVLKPLIPCGSIEGHTASVQANMLRCAFSLRQSGSQIFAPLSIKISAI